MSKRTAKRSTTATAPFEPNALIPAQACRLVGCASQTLDRAMNSKHAGLETFEHLGTRMVSRRSVLRWHKARLAKAAARVAAMESGSVGDA